MSMLTIYTAIYDIAKAVDLVHF